VRAGVVVVDHADVLNADVVIACADLVGRAGAEDFEIGYLHDDVPAEEAGWYAVARYRGARLTADDHRSPSTAAVALAERLLTDARCRCGQAVTLADGRAGCRWQLAGKRWEPGCDARPIRMAAGTRGDVAAMQRTAHEHWSGNRASKRKDGR
jgi:hypothetical protein